MREDRNQDVRPTRRAVLSGALTVGMGTVLGVGAVAGTAVPAHADDSFYQPGWRWCSLCKGLFYALNGNTGACPSNNGARHVGTTSAHYTVEAITTPRTDEPLQTDWRWCWNCQSFAYAGSGAGRCAAGNTHVHAGSLDYGLYYTSDPGPFEETVAQWQWNWCGRGCHTLFYGPHAADSWCPVGGRHKNTVSYNYRLAYE